MTIVPVITLSCIVRNKFRLTLPYLSKSMKQCSQQMLCRNNQTLQLLLSNTTASLQDHHCLGPVLSHLFLLCVVLITLKGLGGWIDTQYIPEEFSLEHD